MSAHCEPAGHRVRFQQLSYSPPAATIQPETIRLSSAIDTAALHAQMQALGPRLQVSCPSVHEFADGFYLRQTFIPADTLVLGYKHKRDSINMLLSGRVALIVDGRVVVLTAGECFISAAGEQKVAYTLSDIVCANIFQTEAATVEEVEAEIYEKDPAKWAA